MGHFEVTNVVVSAYQSQTLRLQHNISCDCCINELNKGNEIKPTQPYHTLQHALSEVTHYEKTIAAGKCQTQALTVS